MAQSVTDGPFSMTVCRLDLFSSVLSGTLILLVRDTLILSLAMFSRLGASGSGGGEVPRHIKYRIAASRFSASGALSSDSSVIDSRRRGSGAGGCAGTEPREYLGSVEVRRLLLTLSAGEGS